MHFDGTIRNTQYTLQGLKLTVIIPEGSPGCHREQLTEDLSSGQLRRSIQCSAKKTLYPFVEECSPPFTEFTSAFMETYREGREINMPSMIEDRPAVPGQQMPGKGLAGQAVSFFPFIYIMRSTLKSLVEALVSRTLQKEIANEERTDKKASGQMSLQLRLTWCKKPCHSCACWNLPTQGSGKHLRRSSP